MEWGGEEDCGWEESLKKEQFSRRWKGGRGKVYVEVEVQKFMWK